MAKTFKHDWDPLLKCTQGRKSWSVKGKSISGSKKIKSCSTEQITLEDDMMLTDSDLVPGAYFIKKPDDTTQLAPKESKKKVK